MWLRPLSHYFAAFLGSLVTYCIRPFLNQQTMDKSYRPRPVVPKVWSPTRTSSPRAAWQRVKMQIPELQN